MQAKPLILLGVFDVGFGIIKETPKEHDSEKDQMSSIMDVIMGQNCLSSNGCSGSLVERVRLSFISWIYMI